MQKKSSVYITSRKLASTWTKTQDSIPHMRSKSLTCLHLIYSSFQDDLTHVCDAYLFVRDELPHADEDMPNLGRPNVQVVVKIQKFESGRYLVVGKLC